MLGLKSNISKGIWSDGVEFNSSHDSPRPDKAPPRKRLDEQCYFFSNSWIYKDGEGLSFVECTYLEEKIENGFFCKTFVKPSSSSVAVILVVVLLIVIALIAAVAIAYIKKEWINNKVFGTPAENLETSEKNTSDE